MVALTFLRSELSVAAGRLTHPKYDEAQMKRINDNVLVSTGAAQLAEQLPGLRFAEPFGPHTGMTPRLLQDAPRSPAS